MNDEELIFNFICKVLSEKTCSKANNSFEEFYFKGKEINLETRINFNPEDSKIFFQEISKHFSFGEHVFLEFQGKETINIKQIVDKVCQLTTDPIFGTFCSKFWGNNDNINEKAFTELLDFAY